MKTPDCTGRGERAARRAEGGLGGREEEGGEGREEEEEVPSPRLPLSPHVPPPAPAGG